jgi:hypothetical protein
MGQEDAIPRKAGGKHEKVCRNSGNTTFGGLPDGSAIEEHDRNYHDQDQYLEWIACRPKLLHDARTTKGLGWKRELHADGDE